MTWLRQPAGKFGTFLGLAVAISLLFIPTYAFVVRAQENVTPAAQNGALQLVAGSATAIPTTPLNGRVNINLQNFGATDLWCGTTAATATSTTGQKCPAGSINCNFPLGYSKGSGNVVLYCTPGATQVSPADTRWFESGY